MSLYETGVAYFERAGRLGPGANTIALPASHVDDALKTLIVLSDGAPVRVGAVEFESVLSQGLARVQAGLPKDQEQRLSYAMLLESLRGLEVELVKVDGEKLRGRLVEVTEVPAPPAAPPNPERAASAETARNTLPRYALTLLTNASGVVRLDTSRLVGVRPTDTALAARLDSAIDTASQRGAQSTRLLHIAATSGAPLRVGYIAETPVWRATYRLLLGSGRDRAVLQGWVLVHNDSDEAWRAVSLEIVNGKPDSYLYPLTAPRYRRRPLSTPEEMSTLPQLATKTADQIWGDRDENGDDEVGAEYGAGGLGLSGIGTGGGGMGHGIGEASSASKATDEISLGNLASIGQSEGVANGAKFRYRMAEPVTLGAHSSALVPFTTVALSARSMTRFQWGESSGRVAAQITNSSSQTLPAGPLAIYDSAGLAGETSLPRLVSGQDTWASYGEDLDVQVDELGALVDQRSTKLVAFQDDQLLDHYLRHREQTLRIENRSALPRSVCVEVPVVNNATIQGADRIVYDAGSQQPLAIFELAPHERLERKLVFEEGLKRSLPLSALSETTLNELATAKDLKPTARAALLEARDFLARRGRPLKLKQQNSDDLRRIEADTKRLEETIEKLKGTSGNGAEPLVRRLVELEARRNRLEREQITMAETEAQQVPLLAAILQRLNDEH